MSTVNIKPAATGNYNHRYNPVTVASMDFSELVPMRVFECNIGDHIKKFAGKGFLRLAPQVFPAYGRVQLKSAAFFVPEYQLLQQSSAIHSNMNMYKGKSVVIPWFYSTDINKMFYLHRAQNDDLRLCEEVAATYTPFNSQSMPALDSYDFMYAIESEEQGHVGEAYYLYYKLTKLGQVIYKLLKSLGYDFASLASGTGSGAANYSTAFTAVQTKVNILPILAYLKIYCDMFLNSNRYNDSVVVEILHKIHDCEDAYNALEQKVYSASTGYMDCDAIFNLLYQSRAPHQHNMYLDSWNSPSSPTGISPSATVLSENPEGVISPYLYDNGSGFKNVTEATQDGTVLRQRNSAGTYNAISSLSKFGLNLLQSFASYVQRNNLFGNKSVQRIFARFGVKADDFKSHYVHKLFEGSSDIDFSAIMSNTDNFVAASGGSPESGKTLGAYAGFGVCGMNFDFNYKCSDFGYIIVLSWLQIVPMLMRGFNPSVLRMNPFDWYTPEYDGATVRAIPMMEISVCKSAKDNSVNNNGDKKIFGFTNLYDDYRMQRDSVLGDFVTSKNARNFLFARDLSYFRQATNPSVMKPQTQAIQYWDLRGNPDITNPFQMDFQNGDRFYFQINFDIQASRSVKSESEVLDLNGTGDLDMPLGGVQMS